jgi:DNA-binding IclR family transcriptional regulator
MPREASDVKPNDSPAGESDVNESPLGLDTSKEHRTVSRVATILELVAAAEPTGVRLTTLASALAAPKSSIHSLVGGLVARGYLVSEGSHYRIGSAPAVLLAQPRPPLTELARRPMEQLRDQFDETVSLSELVGDSYVYVATVESRQSIRFSAPMGERSGLYPRSPGKVYLAAMTERRMRSYFAAYLDGRYELEEVLADLAEVRRRGYSVQSGESLPGLSAAAAGVVIGGRVKSTLSIAGPSERMASRFDEMGPAVRDAAAALSRLLP